MKIILTILCCTYSLLCEAQNKVQIPSDSAHFIQPNDTLNSKKSNVIAKQVNWQQDTSFFYLFHGPLLPSYSKATFRLEQEKPVQSKDELFYLFVLLLLQVGMLKLIFPRYFYNLFKLFSQNLFRQKQARDQLIQNYLPSIMLNLFFVLTTSLLFTLTAIKNNWINENFWTLFFDTCAVITIIYISKFIFLHFIGWIFDLESVAGTYSFIIFIINKLIGIVLIPLLLIIAFSGPALVSIAITVGVSVVILLILYRYVISFNTIRYDLNINALHFFIYLCAIEIAPLLVIYKLLINQFRG